MQLPIAAITCVPVLLEPDTLHDPDPFQPYPSFSGGSSTHDPLTYTVIELLLLELLFDEVFDDEDGVVETLTTFEVDWLFDNGAKGHEELPFQP